MTITKSQQAPLVVIVGATGNQGGSVLKNLAESDKEYRIRALTRDASKPKAITLTEGGAELFEVDLKPENKAKILEAFRGADIVYAVTNYWEHMDAARETAEGKVMIDAAIEAKVGLFIYSGLPSYSKVSNGVYNKVYHFESKAIIDDYGRSKITPTFNYRTVQAAFFYSNFLNRDMFAFFPKDKDGVFTGNYVGTEEVVNNKPMPLVDIPGDYGLWVRAVIEQKEVRDDPRPVLAQSDEMSISDAMKLLKQKTGQEFKINALTEEQFQANLPPYMPPFLVEDLTDSWKAMFDVGYWGDYDVHWTDKYLARKPLGLEEWLSTSDLSAYSE